MCYYKPATFNTYVFVAISTISLTLTACGSRGSSNVEPSNQVQETNKPLDKLMKDGVTLNIGLTYEVTTPEYSAKHLKPECSKDDGGYCISVADYKYLCSKARGISKQMTNSLTTTRSDVEYLVKNGNIDDISIRWEEHRYTDGNDHGMCIASITASGIVDGSSVRKDTNGVVTGFVYSGGKILAHESSGSYEGYIISSL